MYSYITEQYRFINEYGKNMIIIINLRTYFLVYKHVVSRT